MKQIKGLPTQKLFEINKKILPSFTQLYNRRRYEMLRIYYYFGYNVGTVRPLPQAYRAHTKRPVSIMHPLRLQ